MTLFETLQSWAQSAGPWSVPALGLASFLEYVFPPFPGDTVLVVGASLASLGLQPWWLVFTAVTAGSMGGSAATYFFGRWAGRKAEKVPVHPAHLKLFSRDRIHRFEAAYRKHGRLYILINRFVPGLRAVFFILAGASGMPFGDVMLYGTISAMAWCGLLLGAGYALGKNVGRLQQFYETYTQFAWMAIATVAVLALVWLLWKKIRSRPAVR